jgi:hypothetical protein
MPDARPSSDVVTLDITEAVSGATSTALPQADAIWDLPDMRRPHRPRSGRRCRSPAWTDRFSAVAATLEAHSYQRQ